MRDPNRIEVLLARIRSIWSTNPDLRLGQILVNSLNHLAHEASPNLFYLEDDDLIKALSKYREMIAMGDEMTKTIFIPHATLNRSLFFQPGETLEELEKTIGHPCQYQQDWPHPDGGYVDVVVVDSPHAKVSELSNVFSTKQPYWSE